MSANSVAALRQTAGEDFAKIAENHLQHDLTAEDRTKLEGAAKVLSTHALVGSIVGLGLSTLLAYRLRSSRTRMFSAFKAMEKPTHVQFKDGRTEAIPDVSNILKPSTLGDVAAYTFFGAGGLFLGGETGALTGSMWATRSLSKDPEAQKRIETAFRRFRADILRQEAEMLETGKGSVKGF